MNSSEADRIVLQALTLATMGTMQTYSAPRHLARDDRDDRGKVGTNRPKKKKKFGKKKK